MVIGQPVTASCGDYEYLCVVTEPIGGHYAVVDVVATINNENLEILDKPLKRKWYVVDEDDGRANDLYLVYLSMTGKPSSLKFDIEEIKRYSIRGQII